MFYETALRDKALLPRDPFKAIVAPRPIGWISTRAPDGRVNLAPYSFFNAFSSVPPIVGFSSEGCKDSASFARDSGEFVANLASRDLMQAMNLDFGGAAARRQRIRPRRPRHGAVSAGQGAARRRGARGAGVQGRRDRAAEGRARRSRSTPISCSAKSSPSISTTR